MEIKLIPLQKHGDSRGQLIALEEGINVPFDIKRIYYMFDTGTDITRGFHAHRSLKQIAVAVSGSCRFTLDDGHDRVDILLDNPAQGLLIDSCVWREMSDFSEDCVLMVLADSLYDEGDYIRDYDDFIREVRGE